MRLLVTGGAGFIGSNYVRRLSDGTLRGVSEILVLDKLTYAGNLKNLESIPRDRFQFIHGDICDYSLMMELANKFDAVVNFAAESHVDRSINSPAVFVETNIRGTHVLLDVIKSYPEKRLLQVSTDEVYGSIRLGSWDESSPLLPNSPYSASKAAADLLLRSYFVTFNLNALITRSSNNYGSFQHPEKFIPVIIRNLMSGRKVPLYGNGMNVRDWIHVDDNCRAIHEVLLRGKPGEIYNIGGGNEFSNIEIIRIILNLLTMVEDKNIEMVPDRKGHDFRYSVNPDKIRQELGFIPTIDFRTGLRQTINWYKENESWTFATHENIQ